MDIFVQFSQIVPKKSKNSHNSKTMKNFEILICACPTAMKRSTNRPDHFTVLPDHKQFFVYFSSNFIFLCSPYDSTAFKMLLKLHTIKDITKENNSPQGEF